MSQPPRREPPVLLVVEDDPLVRMTLVDALSEDFAGSFEVLNAVDADEAMEIIRRRQDIAALLTDIDLPSIADGYALARAARALRPDLVVVYSSGRHDAPPPSAAVAETRILAKPFTPAFAAAVIRFLLPASPMTLGVRGTDERGG